MSIRDILGRELQLPPLQGWQCPVCKRVYSPITPTCYHCNKQADQNEAAVEPNAEKEDRATISPYPESQTISISSADIPPFSIRFKS